MSHRLTRYLLGPVLVLLALLTACSSPPPAPDWALAAQAAARRATAADLDGVQRVAEVEWAIAWRETARTAEPARLARLALLRCAVAQAALAPPPCTAYAALQAEAAPAEQAYARYLAGQPGAADAPWLPAWHRPVAQALLGPLPAGPIRLPSLPEDPLARLVAVSVLLQAGQVSAELLALAVDTAAAQGWRRPLLAWLSQQAAWADRQGDGVLAAAARRRIALLAESAAPQAQP